MSYILNALKKVENKELDEENLNRKKQILILKRHTRSGKLRTLALITGLLATLLAGWPLGQQDRLQLHNKKTMATTDTPFFAGHEHGNLSEKTNGTVTGMGLHEGRDNKITPKLKPNADAISPPIPIRKTVTRVNLPPEQSIQQTLVQREEPVIEKPLTNYSALPVLVRQQLPPLKVSLHFYNSNPARRIVRIDGKILHENDRINGKLSIEKITTTTAILNYDGQRFELNAPGR